MRNWSKNRGKKRKCRHTIVKKRDFRQRIMEQNAQFIKGSKKKTNIS